LLGEPLVGTLFIGKDDLKPINVLIHQDDLFAVNANLMKYIETTIRKRK